MKSLIIGNGEVGSSLYQVIKDYHETYIRDIENLEIDGIEVLHLCFPYSDKFVEIANGYIDKYKPKLTINHSSVAIGTTEQLKGDVCYSPIRGKHPNLTEGIRVFDKFIAGDWEPAQIARKYFNEVGIVLVVICERRAMRDLEFCKLMSNIRYGYEICFMQESERIANKFGVDMTNFKFWESSYNTGYELLGEEKLKRPILYGGYIGGHCVMQNVDILGSQYKSEMFDWIKLSNRKKEIENDSV